MRGHFRYNFASTSSNASTEVAPAATAPPSGVTMEQIQKLLAERDVCDVYWVNWLSSKERESAGKKPETADEPPSVSTSEFYVPQPSATSVGVYRQACSGIPLAVRFVGRDRLLWNSMVQGTQDLDRFGP